MAGMDSGGNPTDHTNATYDSDENGVVDTSDDRPSAGTNVSEDSNNNFNVADMSVQAATYCYAASDNVQMARWDISAGTHTTLANGSGWSNDCDITQTNDGRIYGIDDGGAWQYYDISADSWSGGLSNVSDMNAGVGVTRDSY